MKNEIIENEFIFGSNVQFSSCHASTVIKTEDNSIICAWFGGSCEGADDVGIWTSTKNQNGKWTEPKKVSADNSVAHWNPVLFKTKDRKIILYFKYGRKIADWITYYIISEDNGITWSEPEILVPNDFSGGRGPVKNKCLRLYDGSILAPASTEQNHKWIPFIDYSPDDGYTWIKQEEMKRPLYRGKPVDMIQPSLWQNKDGSVHCLMRSNAGALYRSDSYDKGVTWNVPYRTDIPNNNSGIDCVKDSEERLWLVYNPVGKSGGKRSPLILSVSEDNGITFKKIIELEKGEGEFSYPAIIYSDGFLLITYTYKRKNIKFIKIQIM